MKTLSILLLAAASLLANQFDTRVYLITIDAPTTRMPSEYDVLNVLAGMSNMGPEEWAVEVWRVDRKTYHATIRTYPKMLPVPSQVRTALRRNSEDSVPFTVRVVEPGERFR